MNGAKMSGTEKKSIIRVQRETIWHMSCGACGYYWTVPTMNSQDSPVRRQWTCPLCATKSPAKEAEE